MATLTHDERRRRREQMAIEIRRGASISTVCRTFGVTVQLLRLACREFGVDFPKPKAAKAKTK